MFFIEVCQVDPCICKKKKLKKGANLFFFFWFLVKNLKVGVNCPNFSF